MAFGPSNGGWPDEQLVEHAPQAVLVAATVHVAAQRLLRAHVVGCPHRHPRLGQLLARGCLDCLGNPEVGHEGMTALKQDVLRLDVAVDDLAFVGVLQRLSRLADDAERVLDGKLVFPDEPVANRLALDEGHHIVEEAVGHPGVVQAEDVGVLELGSDADFAEETVGTDGGRQLRLEHLDGHHALVLRVAGQVDEGHPALTQQALHVVMAGQGFPQSFQLIGHGHSGKGEESKQSGYRILAD